MRTQTFDIIRVLACFMVVCIHAPLPGDNANGLFLSTLSYFTAPCIGLFFMLSGALLLPVRTGTKEFLKKRLAKVCFPLLVWSIFYICCNVYRGAEETNILRTVCSLPFSTQGNPVLWFMYTLIGLYLLAPILSHWLTVVSRRELEFYLALWGITLCYPILTYVVDCNRSNTAMLHYFTGYIGYFVLGYYLKTYPKRLSFRTLVPAMILSVAAPVLCKCFRIEVDFYEMFWYLSVFVVIQCLFWWRCIMAIGGGRKANNEDANNRFKTLLRYLPDTYFHYEVCVMALGLCSFHKLLHAANRNHRSPDFCVISRSCLAHKPVAVCRIYNRV